MDSRDLKPNADMPPDAVKALMMLRSEMAQREARMGASFNEQVQSLRREVQQFRRDIEGIVGGAGARIVREAKDAVSPVAAEYGRAISATSAHLQGASRTVWAWFAAAGSILLLVLLVAWAVLGYYRRELAQAQDELARYEHAVPVVQAFFASDAVVCDGRICVNVDPEGRLRGDRKQYQQARPRP
ncbi:hypothetical protein [Luteimonas huabeiensis]|uniref:hypothetical protein n=1 Tax=Luteimonas huabeiensis TaxID=1244513 RepID=UPI001F316CF8|nr:hypothetical protein [Luteimonas huabeiensis]